MRLLPGRSGVACRAVLVPAGRTLFVQVDDADPVAALVLRHRSGSELVVPVDRRPFDPVATATAQTDGNEDLQVAGTWTVAARLANGGERRVDWDGSGPVEDVALLAPPDPATGWRLTPGRDRRGRLVLEATPPAPAAQADRVAVGADGVALAGRVLGTSAAALSLVATADDGRVAVAGVDTDAAGWRVALAAGALPAGELPMRWTLRLRLADGSDVPVGRPLSDLTALPQVYRYPWSSDTATGVQVRPQYTYSRRLELHQRAPGATG